VEYEFGDGHLMRQVVCLGFDGCDSASFSEAPESCVNFLGTLAPGCHLNSWWEKRALEVLGG
jgi:hypothetical protein